MDSVVADDESADRGGGGDGAVADDGNEDF